MSKMSFADVIREAMKRDGRSLQRLAADSGVDAASLCRFMQAKRSMGLDSVEKLCRTLGLELRRVKKGGK